MSDGHFDDLVPPDHPGFVGEKLTQEELYAYTVESSPYLHGTTWRWARWRERAAVSYDPKTGEETPDVWDHDHCHFCYQTAFSERYDGDLREGWTTSGPAGKPVSEQQPNYHWVCPQCFVQLRERFQWKVSRTP
jgi:hypothetical protein